MCEAAPEKEGGSVLMLSPLVFSLLFHFVIIPAISAVTDCALPLLLRVRFSGFAGRGKKPAWCKKHEPGLKRQRDGNRCPRWCCVATSVVDTAREVAEDSLCLARAGAATSLVILFCFPLSLLSVCFLRSFKLYKPGVSSRAKTQRCVILLEVMSPCAKLPDSS